MGEEVDTAGGTTRALLALERRIRDLETTLLGRSTGTAESKLESINSIKDADDRSVRRRLYDVERKLTETRKSAPSVRALLDKRKELEALIGDPSGLAVEDCRVKEELIISYADELQRRVGPQYDAVKELGAFVDSDRLGNDRDAWTQRLDDLWKRQIEIATRTEAFERRLSNLVSFHHKTTEALSMKFIEWDRSLRTAETGGDSQHTK
eukprot:g1052.t1